MPTLQTMSTVVLLTILMIAVVEDIRHHRISNRLVMTTLLLGCSFHLITSGLTNIVFLVAGIGTGFFTLVPFYLLGGMGAGDVKLFSAIGAFLGPQSTLFAVALTLMAGALIALIVYFFHRQRINSDIRNSETNLAIKPISFPYAPAIALGTVGTLMII